MHQSIHVLCIKSSIVMMIHHVIKPVDMANDRPHHSPVHPGSFGASEIVHDLFFVSIQLVVCCKIIKPMVKYTEFSTSPGLANKLVKILRNCISSNYLLNLKYNWHN